jgi:hypothetical protein
MFSNEFDETLANEQAVGLNLALADFQAQSLENFVEAGYDSTAALNAAKAAATNWTFKEFANPLYPTGTVDLTNTAPLHGFLPLPVSRVTAFEETTDEKRNAIYLAVQQKWNEANENLTDALALITAKIDEILATP